MKLGLEGKKVLITGASKGIGLAAAWSFAREGADLHLAARSEEALVEAKAAIEAECGVAVTIYPMDLSSDAQMVALADAAGDVDILVNNAGNIPSGPIDAVDDVSWRRGFDLKVFGYISLTRAVYARMVRLMKRRAVDMFGDETRWRELFDRYPGGRPATAEEVADLMVFLSSPRAGYVSGTIVTIDGGIASRGSIIKDGGRKSVAAPAFQEPAFQETGA